MGTKRVTDFPRSPVLTTGQAARACGCAPRTVCKWIDKGSLRGYRLPGSEDRRIARTDLIAFMRANEMFIPTWLAGEPSRVTLWLPQADIDALGEGWVPVKPSRYFLANHEIAAAVIGDEHGTNAAVEFARIILGYWPMAKVTLVIAEDCPGVPEWTPKEGKIIKRPVNWHGTAAEAVR